MNKKDTSCPNAPQDKKIATRCYVVNYYAAHATGWALLSKGLLCIMCFGFF